MEKSSQTTCKKRHFCNVDIHCHCLPGIDDGPVDMSSSIHMCRALSDDGIDTVIATPHQLGRYGDGNEPWLIRELTARLNEQMQQQHIGLNIVPGAEVRVDERLCRLIEDDKVLTLADGGKYILLELPAEVVIDIEPLIVDLNAMGLSPVIAHPERHRRLVDNERLIKRWLGAGAYLQISAGSVLGDFGMAAQKAAWSLLKNEMVSCVATDSHGTPTRRPRMAAAYEAIRGKLGRSNSDLICIENPRSVLQGKTITPRYSLNGVGAV